VKYTIWFKGDYKLDADTMMYESRVETLKAAESIGVLIQRKGMAIVLSDGRYPVTRLNLASTVSAHSRKGTNVTEKLPYRLLSTKKMGQFALVREEKTYIRKKSCRVPSEGIGYTTQNDKVARGA